MNAPLSQPLYGLDEDWSKVDPSTARTQGFHFIVGYVSQDHTGKNITRAQIDSAHAHGLDVALVFEYAPESARSGAYGGTVDAGIACYNAWALRAPQGMTIYFAIDYDARTGSEMATVAQYLIAAQKVCAAKGYRVGAYAGYYVCLFLADHGFDGFLWQTYAWSRGQWESSVVLRQVENSIHVGTAVVDRDEQMRPLFGQWRPDGSVGNLGSVGDGNPLPPNDSRLKDEMRLFVINVQLPGGGNLDGVTDGRGYWHYLPTGESLTAAQAAYGNAVFDGPLAVARDAFGLQLDDDGNLTPPAPRPAPTPAPTPSPQPTPPEQAMLDIWKDIATSLKVMADDFAEASGAVVHAASRTLAATFPDRSPAGDDQAPEQPAQEDAAAPSAAPVDSQP